MLRSLLEKWSRGIVLKRRLPAEFGGRTLYVSPEGGGLRYWKPRLDTIDPMLLHTVREFVKPGHTVWDIGGNLGFFAFPAAVRAKGGRVAVFEPDIFLCHLLRKSTEANPDLPIDIFPLAVSNRDGVAQFNIAERARSTNFLEEASGTTQTGGVRSTLSVPTIRLDSFSQHYPAPDFVKIDVEGAENLVIEGMLEILKNKKPAILCEVSALNFNYVSKTLLAHGYQLFDADQLPERIPAGTPIANILAIPAT